MGSDGDKDLVTRFAALCRFLERFPDVGDQLRSAGAGDAFDRIAELLEAGTFEAAEARSLMDRIDETAMAALGLDGVTAGTKGYHQPFIGYRPASGGALGVRAWVCPRMICARVVTPEESATPPECTLGRAKAAMTEYRPQM